MRALGLGLLCLTLVLAQSTSSYVVQPGDTLASVAARFGLTPQVLAQVNDLSSPSLQPGQTLIIPSLYTVQPGDDLFRIALTHGTTVAALMALNGLRSALLKPGQVLVLPPPASPPSPSPAPALSPTVPLPPLTPSPPLAPTLSNLEEVVQDFIGVPYRYGGHGLDGVDCSGLVDLVFARLGIELPRTTEALWSQLPPAPALRPGVLVFFSYSGRGPDHVGIYLGGGRFVQASSYDGQVVEEGMNLPWYTSVYLGAREVPGLDP